MVDVRFCEQGQENRYSMELNEASNFWEIEV